jgi:hypothetical protein
MDIRESSEKNLGAQEPLIHLVLAETRVGRLVPSRQVCTAWLTNGIGWIANKGPCAADVTKAGRVHSSCSSRLETPHLNTATMASGYGLAGGTYTSISGGYYSELWRGADAPERAQWHHEERNLNKCEEQQRRPHDATTHAEYTSLLKIHGSTGGIRSGSSVWS